MRLLVLHTRLSGYIRACLKTLQEAYGCDVLTYAYSPDDDAPFSQQQFSDIGEIRDRRKTSPARLFEAAHAFQPSAILVSGWIDSAYLHVCRALKRRGVPVIAGCDTQWTGAIRQCMAAILAPAYLHTAFDVLWVAGERQHRLAEALGFRGARCWDGYYSCDWQQFASNAIESHDGIRPKAFIYVGRYVAAKGIDTLAAAYKAYRHGISAPWPLICSGTGPMRQTLVEAGGIDHGFTQPDDLPALLARAAVFIMPSTKEPWGVALHEAAASRLPLIASRACGATVHLVRDGTNGWTFAPGDVARLTELMTYMHRAPPSHHQAMGKASHLLSAQYTPDQWARQLHDGVTALATLTSHRPRWRRTRSR